MTTVVRNVRLADPAFRDPIDIIIEEGRIRELSPAGVALGPQAITVEGHGGIAIPGLCNSHLHSDELFMKGTVWGLPLEPYIAVVTAQYPAGTVPPVDDVYIRTLAACKEMIEGGVTMAADDVIHPVVSDEYVEAVLQAYEDSGMRANVSIMLETQPLTHSIPYLKELVPSHLRDLVSIVPNDPQDVVACRRLVERWRSRRVRVMTSPSAPQRCEPAILQALHAISVDFDIPFHIHIQETLVQAVSGPLFFGSSMIRYAERLGILDEHTTIAHGIWLDDDDVSAVAAAGATVVHNPVSNLKLGSGVARVRDLLDAGVNVALGCDGYTCNDSQDMFEAMKLASVLSGLASTSSERWLTPSDALQMATVNGARANRFGSGRLEAGADADIVILDPSAAAFQPLTNPLGEVVFNARRSDVRTVLVAGEVVVKDGRSTRIDAASLEARLSAAAERFWDAIRPGLARGQELAGHISLAYDRALTELPATEVFRLVPDGRRYVASSRDATGL